MKKEDLIKLGLDEEMAQKVAEASAEELKGFIPKARFDEVNNAKKDLEQQLKDRDKQLDDLSKKTKDNEELSKQIKDLQDANDATKKQYEAKIKDMQIEAAIREKLTDTKYPDLLVAKFDKSKLVVASDGTVSGIDDQLTQIKEQYKDLFIPEVKGNPPFNNDKSASGIKNPWGKEHFNLTEQGRIMRENPELAKQLMASAKN
ncbi:MAG: Scaffolding protein [Clostridium sp.]|jgi:vancomycin resistance protein YoaR